ncbi:DNA-binding NarL/FixJ family response regulator [Fontibacillus solani]|uniref:DNA-binding NarL/FixJ family response regulator n=1 Tax=Fontibacillus solani TaxID=1572857 RepID=A0A7W3SUR8_9BACL|nr:hypothetical protein [Fontibacillus solani]MBA9086636.1 DNA-binding NarL/FixJ family response regulator [Fontibacillus solani]
MSYDEEISVFGEASCRDEAIAWAESGYVFDVVLMDINLPGALFDGIDAMLDISERMTSIGKKLSGRLAKKLGYSRFSRSIIGGLI